MRTGSHRTAWLDTIQMMMGADARALRRVTQKFLLQCAVFNIRVKRDRVFETTLF